LEYQIRPVVIKPNFWNTQLVHSTVCIRLFKKMMICIDYIVCIFSESAGNDEGEMAKNKAAITKPLSIAPTWRYIEEQAEQFVLRYRQETREQALSKLFVREFLALFGIDAVLVGSYEHQVKKLGEKYGFIDCFLPGKLVIEFKSTGKNLDMALLQAIDYLPGLSQEERPRYILICDFAHFRLHDLVDRANDLEFPLSDLPIQVKLFGFLLDQKSQATATEKAVDVLAAELMGELHDELRTNGYAGHDLQILLVRLLFCLFADDTGIFEHHGFQNLIVHRTHPDGSNLFSELEGLFDTLNTAEGSRQKNLPDYLQGFPFVNGKLFQDKIGKVYASAGIRTILLSCGKVNWSAISPAIFGSMFQAVMEEEKSATSNKRRNLGAHYTSETNILKLITPLFLDSLRSELKACGKNRQKLTTFHDKLAKLCFLDPACGCGNFLIIAYRELRRLELEVLDLLYPKDPRGVRQGVLDVAVIVKVNVDQFYGIEIEDFPAQVAQVAMWLMDHLMNREASSLFGQSFKRLPLAKSATIVNGNALQLDWPPGMDYLLGNPPFVGSKMLNAAQRAEVLQTFGNLKGAGVLDYVACWYRRAATYMSKSNVRCAFVSTNSITQGEQVGILWGELLRLGMNIHFAHRTFQWNNEARGQAAVHCVIIGFGPGDVAEKWLFDYETLKSEPHAVKANNINPYLVDGPDVVLYKRSKPLCNIAEMTKGSQPTDAGNLLLTDEEKNVLSEKEPKAALWIRPFVGADEFINGISRWCLWLKNCPPDVLRAMPVVLKRIDAVRQTRLASKKADTREWAQHPTLFTEDRQPEKTYLLVPSVSSERRYYIPIGFMAPEVVASNLVLTIPNATAYHFGVLSSTMHNAWMRAVCGRMKSDYRYSAGIVYNNFPWPKEPSDQQQQAVADKAQAVLNTRIQYPDSTLADLYDPLSMPAELTKAHRELDTAVDNCYGVKGFTGEAQRVEFLFRLYEEYGKGKK